MCGYDLFQWGILTYVLSFAFQVAGAVLLIIKYYGKTKERIIEEYFPGSNFAERDDDDNVILEKRKVRECVKRIYDNRMAFLFIAVGYVLAIFGDASGINRICLLLLVVFCTIIIIILEKAGSAIIAKLLYRNDIQITYKELEDRADTLPTAKEIQEMFDCD